ncbi:MAG: transglycosylase domain-containing protein [Clostridiaceae bacterium]|nr:transglycosylase domain-containing protein [Clostridiaceae bacterium]
MKFFKRLLLIILLAILLVGSIIFFNGYKLYKTTLDSKSLTDKISEIKNNNSYVSYDKVPDYYLNAIIAVEDHRFKDHGPIDVISIGRAIVSNVQSKELNEGGSTITQQVAKNLYFITEDNVISRKIAEILVAIDLEKNYSKDQILEFYINTIYFGEGYYGIKQASNGYYDKDPIDLTLNEATILAGVPNAPSVYAPTVNPDLAKNRQGKVIRSMVEYNYLSQDEADKIVK